MGLIHGYGINDMPRGTAYKDGKQTPFYMAWTNMLKRCYSSKKHPTYVGCSVCTEWLYLSNFKKWHDANHIPGFDLDKDILKPGNTVYGPDVCRYVPKSINYLLGHKQRTAHKSGVAYHKGTNKFMSNITKHGKCVYLGIFSTEEEAFVVYKKSKETYIKEQATVEFKNGRIDQCIYKALIEWEI